MRGDERGMRGGERGMRGDGKVEVKSRMAGTWLLTPPYHSLVVLP